MVSRCVDFVNSLGNLVSQQGLFSNVQVKLLAQVRYTHCRLHALCIFHAGVFINTFLLLQFGLL